MSNRKWITASGLLAGLLVLACFYFPTRLASAASGPAPNVSKQAADSAANKFRQIQETSASGQPFGTVHISEPELNSYVHYDMEPEFPPGFSNVRLKLQPGRPVGTANVDFDKLKGSLKTQPNPLIGYFLRGSHTLGVQGTLTASNGVGQFHLETVTVDDLVVPQAVVDFLIDHYLRTRYPDVAIDRPFQLGFSIDKLTVESGSVSLTSRSNPANPSNRKLQSERISPK